MSYAVASLNPIFLFWDLLLWKWILYRTGNVCWWLEILCVNVMCCLLPDHFHLFFILHHMFTFGFEFFYYCVIRYMQKQRNVRRYFLWRTLLFYLLDILHHFTSRLVTANLISILRLFCTFVFFLVILHCVFTSFFFVTCKYFALTITW